MPSFAPPRRSRARAVSPRRLFPLALALLLGAGAAHAQSDNAVYEAAIAQAARLCPGHSKERTTPGVRAVPVGALRVLTQRHYTMCPDRRLDAAAPAVWYGQAGVFAWNPDVEGAAKLVARQIDAMTRKQDFPPDTLVWKADGRPAQGAVVPMFEPRPRPVGSY